MAQERITSVQQLKVGDVVSYRFQGRPCGRYEVRSIAAPGPVGSFIEGTWSIIARSLSKDESYITPRDIDLTRGDIELFRKV